MGSVFGRMFLLGLAVVSLLLGYAGASLGAGYTVEDIGDATAISGLNDAGQATGYYFADPGNQFYQSFSYSKTKGRQNVFPALTSFTYGMSDDGTTAGWARFGGVFGAVGAFTWKDGTDTEPGTFDGGVNSYAYAINRSGAVAGKAQRQLGTTQDTLGYYAFRYQGGKLQNLGALPGAGGYGSLSDASALNDAGQAAGSSRVGFQQYNDLHRAVRFETDGSVTDLGNLGGNRSDASGINNTGQVIGSSEVLGSVPGYTGGDHAFFYNNGWLVDLGTFGGPNSQAAKINNSGKVVGYADDGSAIPVERAFVYSGWQLKNIDNGAGKGSAATDVSDGGRVVGYRVGGDGVSRAFLYADDTGMVDLNGTLPANSGWVLNEAHKVNEKGQIAGIGTYNGTPHGFLLTPTVRVTAFTLPAASASLTVPVTFQAADPDGPVSYLITESADVPAAGDPGWSSSAPAAYTFSGPGARTAHAWAKDAMGVISADAVAAVTVTPPALTLTPDQPSPHLSGTPVTFTAQLSGGGNYEYRFTFSDGTTTQTGSYQAASTWSLPATAAGSYTVTVDARTAGASVARDATAALSYRVNDTAPAVPATGVTIGASAAAPHPVGTPVTFTAQGAGSTAYEYRFSLYRFGAWKVVQQYAPTATWTLPPDAPRGSYVVKVDVRGAGSVADSEATNSVNYVLCAAPATGVAFINETGWQPGQELAVEYQNGGGIHQFAAAGSGSDAYEYRFKMYDNATGTWTEVQPWSINHFWNYLNPQLGGYTVKVDVRGRGSASDGDASASMTVRVAGAQATSVTLTPDKSSPQPVGTPVTFTAQANGTSLSTVFEYRFLLNQGGVATQVQGYSSVASWTLPGTIPAGSYTVTVQVRGANSAVAYDAFKTVDFQLAPTAGTGPRVTTFTVPSQLFGGDQPVTGWSLADVGGSTYNVNSTQTYGINSSGQIVGADYTAFLWDWRGRTDLDMVNATAINEAGQVVGFTPGYDTSYAYLYRAGTLTKLTPFGNYPMAAAHAINNNGQIAGSSLAATDMPETRATLWSFTGTNEPVASALPDRDGSPAYGEALGINDGGDAVGYKVVGRVAGQDWGNNRAVLWSKGALIDLSGSCTPGPACGSVAYAINNAGVVVGDYNNQLGGTAWINGVPTALPLLDGSQSSHPAAINNLGQIVGWRSLSGQSSATDHAVLWNQGSAIDLNTLIDPATGYTLWHADGINDNGDIVGSMAVAGSMEARHFRLSPVFGSTITVPVTAFTGSAGATGYLLQEGNVTPGANAAGWSASAPGSYAFSGYGVKTLCAFVKDGAGNVSPGACSQVNVIRNTLPVIGWFSMPASAASRTVAINRFTGFSRAGITGYLVTESATPPAVSNAGWSATAPASFTFSGDGARTAYAWVKDGAGYVSAATSANVTVVIPPSVTAFSMRGLAFGGGGSNGAWTVTDLGKTLKTSLAANAPYPVLTATNQTGVNGLKSYSLANGIGSSGLIAGIGYTKIGTGSNRNDSIYWNNGTALDLGYPNYPYPTYTTGKSQAFGANGNGQVVGVTRAGSAVNKPFRYSLTDGTTILLDLPTGAVSGYAQAINDAGRVVGFSTTTNPGTGEFTIGTAFIWSGVGSVKYIPGAGSGTSRADAISLSGKVAGTTGTPARAFLYDAATDAFATLGTLGGTTSNGYAVNDAGMVAGYSTTAAGASHAFLYNGSTMTDLGVLVGTDTSKARGINSAGMVVGESYTFVSTSSSTNGKGFIYLNGQMFDLNQLIDPASGFTIASAAGINDNGQIVGYGTDSDSTFLPGYNHALLLTPTRAAAGTPSKSAPIVALTAAAGTYPIAGYLVTESATPPAATDAGWSATVPVSFTFQDYGNRTAYAWVKDTAGNVSAASNQQVLLVQPPAPVVTAFSLPASAASRSVAVTTITATAFAGIGGYLVTESPNVPSASDPGWSATVPAGFTFSGQGGDGPMTAYAWVKDSLGTVSAAATATVTVTRQPVQVTLPAGLSVSYDRTAKTITATTSPDGHPVTVTYNGSATAPTAAGTYTVLATVNEDTFWGSATGTLTIAPAALGVTVDAAAKSYGSADPTVTYRITGGTLYDGDALTGGVARDPGENAGSYAIGQGSLSAGGNYQIAFTGNSLTINKAVLTVQADNQSRVYNTGNPGLTASFTGFVNNETAAVLTGAPVLATGAAQASPVGSYPITAALGSLAAANYSFAFVDGSLAVTPAPATVVVTAASSTYDGTAKSATVTTTPPGLSVAVTYNNAGTAPANAGSYAVAATVTDPNYQGNATTTLVINKATPILAWTTPAELDSNIPLGGSQLNAATTVAGSYVYSPAAGQLLEPGSQNLTVTFIPADATNYTTAGATVPLKVLPIGDMAGGSGVTVSDALMALRTVAGLYTPTAQELRRADVSPLVDGKPASDGKVDIGDVVVILRKAVGLESW
ncbi:MBG domain-containing protein [Geomesophilobacter sediminis]|uniref:DUF3466 family protein n=1 Tax=Geomesophilobacter sediminis TaxID=2798584 RepID=A0A8J7J2Q1_9BACT|nr:MBG domain-containing protein [Geomesophilobacter sediminis]MBJ6725068.1 DUF3466 family protein [Geomesophilobacter sediminis]